MTTHNDAAASAIPWTASSDEFDDIWDSSPWAEKQPDQVPDILATMFEQQRHHMQAYAVINEDAQLPPYLRGDLDNRQTQAALREFAGYITEELYEAVNLLKAKPWKQNPSPTNVEAFTEELADFMHFVIEFFILAGLSAEDVFRAYFRKAFINAHRQNSGY